MFIVLNTQSTFTYHTPWGWACSSPIARITSYPAQCRTNLMYLFTFLCYANKRWIPRCQPLDKSPLRCISINAHLQGKQVLWFSTELRLGCQFEARVQHTGRLLIPQAASAWAGPALICVDVNLRWLSWSHYCYSGFTLGRKQEQVLSQDHNISRSIYPLCTLQLVEYSSKVSIKSLKNSQKNLHSNTIKKLALENQKCFPCRVSSSYPRNTLHWMIPLFSAFNYTFFHNAINSTVWWCFPWSQFAIHVSESEYRPWIIVFGSYFLLLSQIR